MKDQRSLVNEVWNGVVMNNARVVAVDTKTQEMPNADQFRAAFRLHPSGVAVVTGTVDGAPVAMTVSSLVSVSAEPPFVAFSLSKQSYATQQLLRTDTVIVHLLSSDTRWLAELGARGGANRFEDATTWANLPTGEPLYRGVHAWMRLQIVDRTEAGTGILCVGRVLHISTEASEAPGSDQSPLVYHSRNWHQLTEASLMDLNELRTPA